MIRCAAMCETIETNAPIGAATAPAPGFVREDLSPRVSLYRGDCLEVLPTFMDGSVSLILTDLPYGTLNRSSEGGKWDSQIPLKPLWREFLRVTKPNAAIVLFAQGMFTAKLMMSMPRYWRYTLVWDKCQASGFLNANKMPLRYHEDILVFYRQLPVYNPQMVDCGRPHKSRGRLLNEITNNCYGKRKEFQTVPTTARFPKSILSFPKPHHRGQHPTEKPVDLLRWLIRSYSNPGDTVLDATMGSGSTGVAAVLEGRGFVGIEREDKYYGIAHRRVSEALTTPQQDSLAI